MDTTEFKELVDEIVLSKGMKKRRSSYYFDNEEIITVLGLQKSSYSLSYYFNLGFVIKGLNKTQFPSYAEGNVRLRFEFQMDGKTTDIIDIKDVPRDYLIDELERNLSCYLLPIKSVQDLKLLLQEQPVLLYQTTLITKQYLEIE